MVSSPPAAAAAAEPELIAERYVVESRLGEGGMGAVFQVNDPRTGRRLALKRLHAKAGSTARLWFEREYFTLSELAHPRIIEVYDYGIDAEGAYYTMELLDGADLREKKQLPMPEVCAILCDVASSLAILHSRGFLHRDVSPRNVRCTADGRAKLIDFGAMAPIGMTHDLVGTPSCTPPEALQLQALDGRADLYSLGIVAYWMLCGRYPYPARTMLELPELWCSNVPEPHRIVPAVPEQLSQLVMQLISLEREGRPRTAGEVAERSSAIGGFSLDDAAGIAVAYLTTPRLVGRNALVTWARGANSGLLERRGGAFVIAGESGVGRTRALDAFVAEAKRVGAVVARATAGDGAGGDFGVAKTLSRQLMLQLPDGIAEIGRSDRLALSPVLEELREPGTPEQPLERRRVQAAFRDWLLGLARGQRLVLAVDDIERVDEPSAALLGMLAHDVERRNLVIAVTRAQGATGLAIDVLTRLGQTFELAALAEPETEELVRSVFGDVENVVMVAQRVHEIARGNPRDTMQLLRHLVDRGTARCEGAAWLLPEKLAEADLPSSMLSAFETRLSTLSAEARELAEALALTDPVWIALNDYFELVNGLDPARLFSALGALMQAGILLPERERYRFAERGTRARLEQLTLPEKKRALHARLASLAERRQAPIRRLHHLLESGQETLAIDELVNELGTDALDYSQQTVELLERAIAASRHPDVPEVSRLSLKLRIAGVSAIAADLPTFVRYAPQALARVRRDSGLDDWEELAALPAAERLPAALKRTHERYLATPENERGFPPGESIKRLARLIGGYTGMAGAATDAGMLLDLPSLSPFFQLAPATCLIQGLVDAQILLDTGKVNEARAAYSAVLEGAGDPEVDLEPAFRDQIKHNVAHVVAAIDTWGARESSLAIADELDKVPKHRANAWHTRRSYYRMLGQIEKVAECQRRIELLQLRDGPQPLRNLAFRTDLPACWLSDDLLGLKGSFPAIEAEAARFPRFRVLRELAHCHYHRLRGEYPAAFERLTEAMAHARPGRHLDWHHIASTHVELLTLLGHATEAIAQARDYVAVCKELGLDLGLLGLQLAHARALLSAGRHEDARVLCDEVILLHEAYGAGGVLLAHCHETRARVALAVGDRPGFEYWSARFAAFSQAAQNPAIRAQYERLVRQGDTSEADRAGLEVMTQGGSTSRSDVLSDTVKDRMASCLDRTERGRSALFLLLDVCGAKRGHLFGMRRGILEHLSSAPDSGAPQALRDALSELIELERRGDEMTAVVEEGTTSIESAGYTRVTDLGYGARLLLARRSGDAAIVGVVAIAQEPGRAVVVPPQLCEAIADVLAERGDVDPVTCLV